MLRLLSRPLRRRTAGTTLAGLVAVVLAASYALAQEKPKCYLMVCTGSVCVAQQIECPKPLPTQPAPPPE